MKRFCAVWLLLLSSAIAACAGSAIEKDGTDDSETVRDFLTVRPLHSGEMVTSLSGARGEEHHFSLAVPGGAKNLRFVQSGGTGDADLYVRFGADTGARRGSWDYRPFTDANDETVVPEAVKSGTWFFMVRGFTSYSGVSVVASFDPASDSVDAGLTPPPDAPPSSVDAGAPPGNVDAGPPFPPPPTGPDCRNMASWPEQWVAFEEQVLTLVNQLRAAGTTCGGTAKPPVPPLAMDPHLREAARCHSLDLGTNNYFSHDSQDGRNPFDRMIAAGYTPWSFLGENIAAGQPTPADAVAAWKGSTGHCNNMMDGGFADTGIGYAFVQSANFDHYWTQDFGRH